MRVVFLLLLCLSGVFAPFPKQHQLNPFNPFIDPVWQTLDKETKKSVYANWLNYEPEKKAFIDYLEQADRRKNADKTAWSEAKQLFKEASKEWVNALKGNLPTPDRTAEVKVEGTKEKPGKVKTTTRYKLGSQLQWENFMAAFQLALHLRSAEKRALYQYFLEHARKMGNKKKSAEKQAKSDTTNLKDKVKGTYLKFLDKYKDKLYKVWVKLKTPRKM
uniref:Uncharacterized protein n=1 Tax=Acartia pacifica TaxID=335913 RepID=A0A0U2V6B2_ACAPC|nr:hypothetical protein [Acartia pacifica]